MNEKEIAYKKACDLLKIKTHIASEHELKQGIIIRDDKMRYIVNKDQIIRQLNAQEPDSIQKLKELEIKELMAAIRKTKRPNIGLTLRCVHGSRAKRRGYIYSLKKQSNDTNKK